MSEQLAQLKKTLMENGLENLAFNEKVTIPKGSANVSVTLSNEAQLLLIYCTADANRHPSLYYKDNMIYKDDVSSPEVRAIGADGKTVTLYIQRYASQYYVANFIME